MFGVKGRCALLAITVTCVAAPPRLLAQRWARPFDTVAPLPRTGSGIAQAASPAGDNPWEAAAGGFMGGALGFWLGGLAGLAFFDCVDDACPVTNFNIGALVGEPLGMTLGAHLANRRRGNFALALLAATATGALGIAVLNEDGWGFYGLSLGEIGAIFLTQVAATAGLERAFGH